MDNTASSNQRLEKILQNNHTTNVPGSDELPANIMGEGDVNGVLSFDFQQSDEEGIVPTD